MNVWVEAARPRTLPASVAPVVVGTAAADRFIAWRAVAALVVALALQVAVNFANDLFDARKGIDTAARVGPRRAVASGAVSEAQMKLAMLAALATAAAAGAALAWAVGPELLLVGAAAIAAALLYSGGPRPYASAGLGELAVFVFFGLVATAGTTYVLDEEVRAVALVAAIPMGAFASAILVANNLRDEATDRAAGKITVAVRLGPARTVILFRILVSLAVVCTTVVALVDGSPWPLLALAVVPLAVPLLRRIRVEATAPELIGVLAGTARVQLAYAFLLGVGLWASS